MITISRSRKFGLVVSLRDYVNPVAVIEALGDLSEAFNGPVA